MFPARRRFLEGLEQAGLVTESRLFLSGSAQSYIHRTIPRKDLPHFNSLSNSDKSVIYLNLGKCHLIEGTHNYSLWLYGQLPQKNPIDTSPFSELTSRDLGMGMKEQYERERGPTIEGLPPYKISHHPNVTWQRKAIQNMKSLRRPVDPEKVLSSVDYNQYLKKYGV